jgi:O-antigen/teichoic acid export membrane protein
LNTSRTITSVSWSIAAKFSRQTIQILFQIFLARILGPKEFGLIAMVAAFITLADILRNFGLGQALIFKKDFDTRHLNTVFWFNAASGFTILIILLFAAEPLAAFYGNPDLVPIVRVFGCISFIGALNIVQDALLQKSLQFKRLFFIEIVSVITGGAIALVLATRGFGVWALVVQFATISFVSSIVLWITSPWRPSFQFDKRIFNELKGFGLNLMGNDLLGYVARNVDTLLIGRMLGAAAVGIYSRAFVLMAQPINLCNTVLGRVMFPILAKLQHDINAVRTTYLKATRLTAFVIFPVVSFVFVMAHDIIFLLLGSAWLEVANILRIFCIYCMLDSIGYTTTWIYKALGRTDIMFRWSIYHTSVIVTAIVIGMQWGLEGVALSYVSAYLVFLWLPGWWLAVRLIQLPLIQMLRNLLPSLVSSIGMAFIIYAIRTEAETWSPLALLAVSCAVALVSYCMLSLLFNRIALDDLFVALRLDKKRRAGNTSKQLQ